MAEPVFLTRLALRRFRNHRATELAPGTAPLVLLTGPNGAGKTNILEAVSLLSPGRGLRRAPVPDMVMEGVPDAAPEGEAGGFRVHADIVTDRTLPPVSFATGTNARQPGRRLLRVNDAPAALSGLSEWLRILWLTPAMDRLFSEPASERRRFLDRLVLALRPAHGRHVSRYEAAMRARNRLLADHDRPDPAWLATLEREMEHHGIAMHAARAGTVAALGEAIAAAPAHAFPRAALRLAGDGGEGLARTLATMRARDAAAKRTLAGPHRADLLVRHLEKDRPAALSSTGEQKAMLIGILMAHAALVAERTGSRPLLLLDEGVAHLDPGRRAALFARLADLGGQTWISGTEAHLFDGVEGRRFLVRGGQVEPV